MTTTMRRIRRTLHVAAAITAAGAILATGVGVAGASGAILPGVDPYPYAPPTITFTTDDSSITATIHNPNTQGICYATIGIPGNTGVNDPNDHSGSVHIFGDDHNVAWPQAGTSFTLTHRDLPRAVYRVSGFCAKSENSVGQGGPVNYEVRVGPTPPTPIFGGIFSGSAGSSN